jgi:hypothetical protein
MSPRTISVQFDNFLAAAQSFLVMKGVTPVKATIEPGDRFCGVTGSAVTVRPKVKICIHCLLFLSTFVGKG